jgi:hypothetical protein
LSPIAVASLIKNAKKIDKKENGFPFRKGDKKKCKSGDGFSLFLSFFFLFLRRRREREGRRGPWDTRKKNMAEKGAHLKAD